MKGRLTNRHLRVVGVDDPEYRFQYHTETHPNGSTVLVGGVNVDLLELLETSLNFTYTVVAGEGWISQAHDGSLLGVGRQILKGEADFSITPSIMAPYRVKALSFLTPFNNDKLVAALKQPVTFSLDSVCGSFPKVHWISSLAIFLLSFIFFKMIEKHGKELVEGNASYSESVQVQTQSFVWMAAIVTQQEMSTTNSARMAYWFLMFAITLTFALFNAALVSTLAVGTIPIKSFRDLVRSDVEIVGDKSLSGLNEIPGENWRMKDFKDVAAGIRFVQEGKGAFVTLRTGIYNGYKAANISHQVVCTELFHFETVRTVPGAMFVRKNSDLKEPLGVALAAFKERGYFKRLNTKWETAVIPLCNRMYSKQRSQRKSLTFHDVLRAFQISIAGIVLGIVVLVLENCRNFLPKVINKIE